MTGIVLAVTGGKGGVGKSTTSINLGVSLRMDGYSVVLVDADVEMPNLMEMLGIDADTTIHDVLSGSAAPNEALVELGDDFGAIPGDNALTGYGSIEPERLHTVVDALTASYDCVILDTGAGLSYDDLFPLAMSDEILLVSTPDPAAIENAKRTQAFVRQLNREVSGVVITKADSAIDDEVARQFGAEIVGVIPDDEAVSRSTAEGKPLELIAPESDAAKAYRQLEANLTDGELPPGRVVRSKSETDSSAEDAGDSESAESDSPETESDVPVNDDETPGADEEGIDPPRRGLVGRITSLVS